MKNLMLLVLLIGSPLLIWANANEAKGILQQANELYRTGEYESAKEQYLSLLNQGYETKSLYYNLGNTYYKLGESGRAVLNYERALVIAPKDRQIKGDLAFVKQQLADEIIPIEVFPLIQFWQNLRNSMSANAWSWLAILFFWLGIAGFVLWVLGPVRKYKKIGFFAGIALILLCSIPFTLAIGKKQLETKPKTAVILEEETALKSSPAEGSETLYMLFEGASVQVIDTLQGWQKVSLANAYQGWVKADRLEKVRP